MTEQISFKLRPVEVGRGDIACTIVDEVRAAILPLRVTIRCTACIDPLQAYRTYLRNTIEPF